MKPSQMQISFLFLASSRTALFDFSIRRWTLNVRNAADEKCVGKKNNNARERKNCVINMNLPSLSCFASELLHHGRQAGEEK